MAHSRKDEARALSADELAHVDQSRHPQVQELSDAALADLIRLLRERRDRAQSEAARRRREMRGKAAAKGARASTDDTGSRLKVEVLAMAMRRLNGEAERRRSKAGRETLIANARNALALRKLRVSASKGGATRTAGEGMRAVENTKAENLTRRSEVGRVSQATKVAQAKRDGR